MQNKRMLARVVALLFAFGLVAAACGSDDEASDEKTTTTAKEGGGDTTAPDDKTTTTAKEGGGDTMAPDSGGGGAGSLVGMKGTTPLVDLSDDFKNKMLEIDPALVDFNYGPEAYDAVIVTALAAEVAKTDGLEMANEINGVTRAGEKCTDFKACVALVKAGKDIDYDGASGPLEFSGNGEPTQASYGILTFGTNCAKLNATRAKDGKDALKECLDDDKTEFKKATAPKEADVAQIDATGTRAGDGVFKVGTLLPKTGSLAFLGPPEFAGVKLAIKEVNDAGGVLGKPAECVCDGDSGDTENKVAPNTVKNQLLPANVDMIVGAASSSVTLSVIDDITTAGVVMFSPANTAKKLSTYEDKGLYFRDAPSDILQGQVLADLMIEDGRSKVYILALNDDYGTGLAEDLIKSLEGGGATVVGQKIYDPKAADYSSEVQEAKSKDPDAIALIGFDESSKILAKMAEQGVAIDTVYGVDGNMANALAENFEAGK